METGPQVSVYSASMPEVRTDMREGVIRAPFSDLFRLYDFRLQRLSDLFWDPWLVSGEAA